MKPYLAILIDSFWETVGNKVLWALLLGWSLLLLGLAPFGFISERNFLLSSADITDRGRLVESLAKATQGKGSLAVQAVASHLDEKFRQRLAQTLAGQDSQGQRRITARDLALALNGAIEADELYSDSAFPSAKRRQQTLLPLIEMPRQSMSADELQELNRHLLQLAFPLELRPSRGEQLWIGYAGFKIGEPLSFTRKQIKQFYEPVLLGMIIKLGLGVLAVFVAIVVTSPIIPDTFRSGSLHLLLSKPISRMWLYLFKFLGGCFFVCVNISFVLLGLFVIAGLRFEIWNTGLLACIPLLMFVFLIFYSISALVGLLWGNAIVSVVACLVFWLFCFALGFLHDALLPQVEVWPQIRRIRSIAGELLTVNEKGEFNVWNERFSIWQPALEAEGRRQARTYGPLYLAPQQTIVSKSFHRGSFGRLETSDRKLALIPLGKTREGDSAEPQQLADESPQTVAEARITPVWMSDVGPDLPQQLFNIVEFDDSLLAICRGGLYLLNSDKLELVQATQQGLWGLQLPWLSPSAFENIAPPSYFLSENSRAAVTQSGEGLVVFNSGEVDYLHYDGQRLNLVHSTLLADGDGTEAAEVQMNDNFCVVARDGLPLQLLDAQLQPLGQLPLPQGEQVRQLACIPASDDLAIITHSGGLWRLDCQTQTVSEVSPELRGQCTCMTWESADRVWLGLKPNRVALWELNPGRMQKQWIPQPSTLEKIYRWGVHPIYLVNPKPAALDSYMSYFLSGDKMQDMHLVTQELQAAQVELDLYTPLISNLLFVAVVLGLSCLYVSRKEF